MIEVKSFASRCLLAAAGRFRPGPNKHCPSIVAGRPRWGASVKSINWTLDWTVTSINTRPGLQSVDNDVVRGGLRGARSAEAGGGMYVVRWPAPLDNG